MTTNIEAGTETTAAAMMSFCLAMTLYPEWQDLAYEEIERVSSENIPTFQDLPHFQWPGL